MPKLGTTVEECTLVAWRRRSGDRVSAGEVIADIETDKAAFEIVAPVDGVLLATFFDEGATVPVFTNICVIGDPGESADQFRPQGSLPQAETPRLAPAPAPAEVTPLAAPPVELSFSPRARRFAAEHQFYPRSVAGSGPGGRVLEEDLRRLYDASPKAPSPAGKELGRTRVRLSGARQTIARRMRESLATAAQYTLNSSAGAAGLLALRNRIKARGRRPDTVDVNIGDMLIFCVVKALLEMPQLNAEFIDGELHQYSSINIGFACDTPRGLLVPVVKECQRLSLEELSLRIKGLAQQAVEGSVAPDDLTGGTFTVSNLGSLGIESFTPILNPPQVALLGVNSIELKPVRRQGGIDFVERLGLSLTCDHQVIDGAVGARFLKILREQIENLESVAELKQEVGKDA
jgi:pyruvate dehydrogenase E2 component (dihydrolipoamide acetyltransferase)